MNPFIGQIIMFGGNFAPRDWAFCQGQLLPIAQYTALFSILGTTYGGDGRTTFALPEMRGRVAISKGQGPGLPTYSLGQRGGSETNTLTLQNLPAHSHTVTIPTNSGPGTESEGFIAASPIYAEESNASYAGVSGNSVGNNQPVNNMGPILTTNYIIALQGTFPSRS
ncbi:MAG: microcystin-dependent protein [Saprospiraceae bacterium]|jgi:microcystin-dependent protein